MKKCIVVIVGIVLFCMGNASYAEDETLELTTYYPAPYGEYEDLKADDVEAARVVASEYLRLMPLNSAPDLTGLTATEKKGIIYYNTIEDDVMYHDGTDWQSGFNRITIGALGDWEVMNGNTIYEADTDGFVLAYYWTNDQDSSVRGFTDENNPPTTIRARASRTLNGDQDYKFIMMPVKRGDFARVVFQGDNVTDATVWWIPIE